MKNLYLISGGGHCRSCIDVIEQAGHYRIQGIFDQKNKIGETVLGYKIIGSDENITDYISSENYFLVTMGQIKSADMRLSIFDDLKKRKANIATIVSPRAYVSPHAKISEGTIVMHGALVNSNAAIGVNCIINTNALIEHDVQMGNHCHISTSAVINGGCIVEDKCFVGSNATLKQGTRIRTEQLIQAGSFYLGE